MKIGVEQIDLRICNGATDRYARGRFPGSVGTGLVRRCDNARLARPVGVDPTNFPYNQPVPGSKRLGGSLLASYDHEPHRRRHGLFQSGKLVYELVPVSSWQVEHGDPLLSDPMHEVPSAQRGGFGPKNQGGASDPGRENLL